MTFAIQLYIIAQIKFQQAITMSNEQSSQSFYSLDQSKTEFTFVAEPAIEANLASSSKLVNLYRIKQSSALQPESSEKEVNQSMHSIIPDRDNEFEGINLHDISQINLQQINQLECSACLEKEIDCLTIPNDPSKEDLQLLEKKIQHLKNDQSMLRRQIEVFQGLMSVTKTTNEQMVKQLMQTNKLMKKKCEHSEQTASPFNFAWPDPNQVSIKSIHEPLESHQPFKAAMKHYDIKPNLNRSPAEQRINALYKSASFERHVVLLDDVENEYRVEVSYEADSVEVTVLNYTRGETNYIYAARFNDHIGTDQKISQKLSYPIVQYQQKRFTISLNILLLFFKEHQPKEESNLIKIQEIRTLSVPLPLSYLVSPRFTHIDDKSFTSRLANRLYVYEIDINYGIDVEAYNRMIDMSWVKNQWISLRGSQKLLRVQLFERGQKDEGVVFRVSIKDRDAQQAIDMIEYLCFMVSL